MKALRDLRQGWISFGACALITALAAALFVAFTAAFLNLGRAAERTYERLKFLDFSLYVGGRPRAVVERLRQVEGVRAVEGRLAFLADYLLDPLPTPASRSRRLPARVIEVPVDRRPEVNDVYIHQGRYLGSTRGEALLEERFARHHGVSPGDILRLSRGDRELRLKVVGLVSSPEFLWLISDVHDPRPAARRLAVVFVSPSDARDLAGQDDINEIHVRVEDPLRTEEVVRRCTALFKPDLTEPPLLRAEQPSHALLVRDRRAFAGVAALFPTVFLTLSGLILAVTLWQLISRQRRQMGILLALGLFPWQIFLHYLTVSVLVGGAGALAGVLVGHLLGQICTRFYADALGLPLVDTPPAWQAMLVALGGALVVSLGAGWWASQRLLGLHPAQALRPEVSSTSRRAPVRLGRRLPLWLRLPLRNLLRQPGRSTVAMLGVASAVAQILMTLAFLDSQEFALRFFFQQVFAYDLRVGLVTQMSPSSLPPVQDWPGVRYSEAYLRQEVILQRGSRRVRTAVWGVPPQARLLRLHDPQRRPLPPPQGDLLLLGTVLMRQLGARPGDTVQMTLDRGPRSRAPTWTYRVGPELFEPVADVAKVGLHQLQRQLLATNPAPPDAVDFLLLDVEPGYHDSVKRRLEREPLVASISDMNDMRSDILDLLRMLDAYKGLMFLFSSILAVAAVTGTTTMSVMERTPELATMSTLGVHRRTLLLMLVTETTMLWLGGFCLGAPAGVALGNWLVNNYQSELLQIQLLVSPSTLLGTAAVSLALCLLAVVNGLRTVLRVPLTEAMSPRE